MKPENLHPWNLSPPEAVELQRQLAGRVVLQPPASLKVRRIAGADISTQKDSDLGWGGIVVLDAETLEPVARESATVPLSFPYVPGLLSFREAPAVLAACAEVETEPDVLLFDGQGYAHPRRFGLASHLGLLFDRPAVGCAKRRLVGYAEEPERVFGAHTLLVDHGETVGAAVRTRPRHAPLFVSPGHKMSVEGAIAVALACCREGAFMPVPTRLAHDAVTALARGG
jgi:deoxyribonuclease V